MALSRRTGQRFQGAIWPGFVDAMTGLLLVLMFVLTIFMVVQFVLRETISGQETELDTLSGEIAALAQALGLEQRRNTALSNQLGALEATLEDRDARLAEQEGIIAALTGTRDRQAAELAEAEGRIASFEEHRELQSRCSSDSPRVRSLIPKTHKLTWGHRWHSCETFTFEKRTWFYVFFAEARWRGQWGRGVRRDRVNPINDWV